MFGMGFTEILIIAVIAILFLGPDKLPGAMVDIAKFFKSAKNAIGSVKDSLEQEMDATGIKAEALAYKKELLEAQEKLSKVTDVKSTVGASISSMTDTMLNDDKSKPKVEQAPSAEQEEVTFKKKKTTDKEDIANV